MDWCPDQNLKLFWQAPMTQPEPSKHRRYEITECGGGQTAGQMYPRCRRIFSTTNLTQLPERTHQNRGVRQGHDRIAADNRLECQKTVEPQIPNKLERLPHMDEPCLHPAFEPA